MHHYAGFSQIGSHMCVYMYIRMYVYMCMCMCVCYLCVSCVSIHKSYIYNYTLSLYCCHTAQWSTELQEQEKVFLEQAQLVNQWDRILTDNGDKVKYAYTMALIWYAVHYCFTIIRCCNVLFHN